MCLQLFRFGISFWYGQSKSYFNIHQRAYARVYVCERLFTSLCVYAPVLLHILLVLSQLFVYCKWMYCAECMCMIGLVSRIQEHTLFSRFLSVSSLHTLLQLTSISFRLCFCSYWLSCSELLLLLLLYYDFDIFFRLLCGWWGEKKYAHTKQHLRRSNWNCMMVFGYKIHTGEPNEKLLLCAPSPSQSSSSLENESSCLSSVLKCDDSAYRIKSITRATRSKYTWSV